MGARNGNPIFHPHQFCQHFSSGNDRDGLLPGGLYLYVVLADGAGYNNDVFTSDILRTVVVADVSSQVLQMIGYPV